MNDSTPHLFHPKYRRDIDGLRAFAILAVIAFHAFPNWVSGGFIGVDIFFVISGFLISRIIFENLQRGTFRFIEFYARRIRRIFPALALVLCASCALGWFTLLTDEYAQLGKHIAGAAGFVLNVVLWKEAGYFDNSAATKPLLHVWSLGVEEQFYLAWPLLVWLAWKCRLNLLAVMLLAAAVSFYFNITLVKEDKIAAFYLLHTRFWELLAGSALAWIALRNQRKPQEHGGLWPHMASLLGLLLLVYGCWHITKELNFPDAWALVPVAGTVLMIAAGPHAWVNQKLFSNKLMVGIGLISYPLYLWHWPLLSFARILEGETPSRDIRLAAVAVSLLLAWLTYRLVERPIRRSEPGVMKIGVLLLLMAMIGFTGYQVYIHDGLNFRPLAQKARILAEYQQLDKKIKAEFSDTGCFNLTQDVSFFVQNGCTTVKWPGRPKVFLFGDSFSAFLSQGLRERLEASRLNLLQISTGRCVPYVINQEKERCQRIYAYAFDEIRRLKPDYLILFSYYSFWSHLSPVSPDIALKETITRMQAAGVKKIIVIGQIPTWKDTLPHALIRNFVVRDKPIPTHTYHGVVQESLEWDERLKRQISGEGVEYISLRELLCNENGCLTLAGSRLESDLIVFDSAHLTEAGAKYIVDNALLEKLSHSKFP